MFLYVDIETIPSQRADIRDMLAETVKPPATLKKPESIQKWIDEEKPAAIEEAWLKTSFDGTYGQVVCVSYTVEDAEPVTLCIADLRPESERDVLRCLWADMRAIHSTSGTRPVISGFNVIGFDLPFLWRRSVIHGVQPPMWWPRNPKPWSDAVADTMLMWAGDRDRISLDRLCRVLGLEGKGDGPTGADVWPMVQAWRMEEICAYCSDDVRRAREIHKRLTFAGAS